MSSANTKLYDTLGISPSATPEEVRQAFKRMALKYHPDRNPGDASAEQKFKEVNSAYEILSDAKKRRIYDQYGEEGLESGGAPGASDFASFFGRRGAQRARTRDVPYKQSVTLADLYNGRTVKIRITRARICTECLGRGTTKPNVDPTCADCNGSGMRVQVKRMGAMIQQSQSPCVSCKGTGSSIKPEDACPGCKGNKTIPTPKEIEIVVRPGMYPGQRIVYHGEADEMPDAETGDLVVILDLVTGPAARAPRRGEPPVSPLRPDFMPMEENSSSLVISHTVELVEALLGWTYTFEHLDGRIITVTSPSTGPTASGDVIVVPGEGMPMVGNPTKKGDLFIKVSVRMPTALSDEAKAALRTYLPPAPEPPAEAARPDAVVAEGAAFDARAQARLAQMRRDDEDAIARQNEEAGGGQGPEGMQCAQM